VRQPAAAQRRTDWIARRQSNLAALHQACSANRERQCSATVVIDLDAQLSEAVNCCRHRSEPCTIIAIDVTAPSRGPRGVARIASRFPRDPQSIAHIARQLRRGTDNVSDPALATVTTLNTELTKCGDHEGGSCD